MALNNAARAAGADAAMVTVTVRLAGLDWDGPPPCPGDLVIAEARHPGTGGPPGWTRCVIDGRAYPAWWVILPAPDPVFTAQGRPVLAFTALAGVQIIRAAA